MRTTKRSPCFSMLLTLVLSIRLAPLFCAKASSARITSLDLSLSGKYLPPRSSFVRTPYALRMFNISVLKKESRELNIKRPLCTIAFMNSSLSAEFVILHLPFPVRKSFLPAFSLRSIISVRAPFLAANAPAISPAAPAPTTKTLFIRNPFRCSSLSSAFVRSPYNHRREALR